MSRFDAAGMRVFPKPWIKTKRLEFGLSAGWNGLTLGWWGEPVRHWSISFWFDKFWSTPVVSLHWSTNADMQSRHIRF